MVRQSIGAFANFKRAVVVKRLPKTRSGKILRQVLRKMVDKRPFTVPSTIDDPAILKEIEGTLRFQRIMEIALSFGITFSRIQAVMNAPSEKTTSRIPNSSIGEFHCQTP